MRLKSISSGKTLFEEKAEDDQIYLTFKDEKLEIAFRERQKDLIDGYAKLLAFEELFKKLSKEYETDLTFHISERVNSIKEFIEQNNEAILFATNLDEGKLEGNKYGFFRQKNALHFEGGLVNIDEIKPDKKAIEEYKKKLRSILGDF